ncbi:N-acetyltransferase [Croceivirga sp. JEA036]|nr:N-acetyltransferase [Croceivirga sp. JEA036]
MQLRYMLAKDWPTVSKIYAEGIATGIATFETNVPSYEDWDAGHLKNCRWVATEANHLIGWAALSPVSSRCVYGGVAEVSIYIASNARGKGIGKQLLQQLILDSEDNGYWTLQSGIFPQNKASVALHITCGFRHLGTRERIAQTKEGIWVDNLLLERRSKIIGQ